MERMGFEMDSRIVFRFNKAYQIQEFQMQLQEMLFRLAIVI